VKDFILYRRPVSRKSQFEDREYNLSELESYRGSSPLPELEKVTSGSLKLLSELKTHTIFEFSCEYYGPKPATSPKPPLLEARFELWQRTKGALVISFNPPKKVSRVAAALLSLAVFGDPSLILPVKFYPSDFLELKKRAEKLEGTLSQLVLHRVQSSGVQLRQVQFIGRHLEKLPNLSGLLKGATDISCMGFVLPELSDRGRRFSFRVTDWGGGQIYSPADPLPHEISELLDLFEATLAIQRAS
jgi:hypothetical protein